MHPDRSYLGTKCAVSWTDILILVPVVVPAIVGFVSFRQDHAAAKRIAKERAQQIAAALGARLKTALLPDASFLDALPYPVLAGTADQGRTAPGPGMG